MYHAASRVAAVFCLAAGVSLANVAPDNHLLAAEIPAVSWIDRLWQLPLFRFVAPQTLQPEAAFEPELNPCGVDPLAEIEDPEALEFEFGGSGPVQIGGLTPPTVLALNRFERVVSAVGGSFFVTSAYRPSAYQEHLQRVWDKWMVELRFNMDPACGTLKAKVEEEFRRHQLLVTQRPVGVSDHTLGVAFDVVVRLPARARWKKRRVGVDSLARMAGVSRPAAAGDPVHFRLLGFVR